MKSNTLALTTGVPSAERTVPATVPVASIATGTTVAESLVASEIAEKHGLYSTAGVHPHHARDCNDATIPALRKIAAHPRVVAIGETGLDYYRLEGDLEWQRERFRTHIRASRETRKPLIIHTRSASEDTIRIMREEGAGTDQGGVAGVMHCFTESLEVARASMEQGFYISFSGIVTFKSAKELQAVALEGLRDLLQERRGHGLRLDHLV